jgi:hypothetical protein
MLQKRVVSFYKYTQVALGPVSLITNCIALSGTYPNDNHLNEEGVLDGYNRGKAPVKLWLRLLFFNKVIWVRGLFFYTS